MYLYKLYTLIYLYILKLYSEKYVFKFNNSYLLKGLEKISVLQVFSVIYFYIISSIYK